MVVVAIVRAEIDVVVFESLGRADRRGLYNARMTAKTATRVATVLMGNDGCGVVSGVDRFSEDMEVTYLSKRELYILKRSLRL